MIHINDVDRTDFNSAFHYAEKGYNYFMHTCFLESCDQVDVRPGGLRIEKRPFISFVDPEFTAIWEDAILSTEKELMQVLIVGIAGKHIHFRDEFWKILKATKEETKSTELFEDWWIKLCVYLDKLERRLVRKKRKKLRKLLKNDEEKLEIALNRFDEHLLNFYFKFDISSFSEELSPDIPNLITLYSFGDPMGHLNGVDVNREGCNSSFNDSNVIEKEGISVESSEENINDILNKGELVEGGRFKGKFVSSNVVNLSGRELSNAEISLLSKGLKFVPTPTFVNKAKIKEELEIYGRKLRLMWHFRNDEKSEINPFRPKSKFNPKGKDAAIEIYLSRLEEEILALDTSLRYSNITKEEREALRNLQNDTSIIIKEADKGSAVVVWDREDYLKEAEKQLSDEKVYEEVSPKYELHLRNIISSFLAKVKVRGDISNQTLDYFMVNKPKLGRFYLLPKIHKRLYNVPGRPVISNTGFYTENISAFLDYHLQPLAKKVRSYVKDTNDFLKKLRDLPSLPNDFLLCTIDVVGLYPNIPNEEGLLAIREALDKRTDKTISTESLMDLAECVIKNNVFEHYTKIYKQKQGTAIGTKMAPPYAILFMASLEEKFLETCVFKPWLWWRYIDDIFMIWQHGEEKLKEFLELLNAAHPTIKFTAEYSDKKINFLDVQVIKEGDRLVTDLYTKPTDTHQYLHSTSCHVYHSKRSIPYSQTLRLNRICSEGKFFDKRCNELEQWLSARGYKDKLVRSQILKARKFSRNELLNRTSNKDGQRQEVLTVNITYHPAYAKLKNILNDIHLLLTPNKEHQKVFPRPPIVGFRRGKSLKDYLVRAKVPEIKPVECGSSCRCNGKRCKVCFYIKETDSFQDKSGNKTFKIKHTINCNSKYVVYLLQCKVCRKQYVGSAETSFRLRFNNYSSCNRRHNAGAKNVPQESLHRHFDQSDHHRMEDWEFILIDQAESLESVRRKEDFWQNMLDTFVPKGLNERQVSLF